MNTWCDSMSSAVCACIIKKTVKVFSGGKVGRLRCFPFRCTGLSWRRQIIALIELHCCHALVNALRKAVPPYEWKISWAKQSSYNSRTDQMNALINPWGNCRAKVHTYTKWWVMIQKLMIFVKLCLSWKDDGGHGHVLPLPDGCTTRHQNFLLKNGIKVFFETKQYYKYCISTRLSSVLNYIH